MITVAVEVLRKSHEYETDRADSGYSAVRDERLGAAVFLAIHQSVAPEAVNRGFTEIVTFGVDCDVSSTVLLCR